MKPNFRQLSFAFAMLIATSTVAYGQSPPISVLTVTVPPKTTPPEPHSSVDPFLDEIVYSPIAGKHSKPFVKVLNSCRVKYSKMVDIHAVWTTRFGRTGWWCVYKRRAH